MTEGCQPALTIWLSSERRSCSGSTPAGATTDNTLKIGTAGNDRKVRKLAYERIVPLGEYLPKYRTLARSSKDQEMRRPYSAR